MATGVNVVFGSFTFGQFSVKDRTKILDTLKAHEVNVIDTARTYPESEQTLGELDVPKMFTVDTKARSFEKGALSKENVLESAKLSLRALKTDSVDVYYLHAPDPDTPIKDTIDAIQELYTAGKFKRFGLSNFSLEGVREIYDYAKEKGYILPSVFQGNYNPLARHIEAELFELLRKLHISFYAYSPLAGGFLAKNVNDITTGVLGGRWDKNQPIGKMYDKLYNRPSLVVALKEWEEIAKDAGISKSALAYRWVTYHSALKPEFGDAIIVGASKLSQLQETLNHIEDGPLSSKTARSVDEIWSKVKHEAPLDNYAY